MQDKMTEVCFVGNDSTYFPLTGQKYDLFAKPTVCTVNVPFQSGKLQVEKQALVALNADTPSLKERLEKADSVYLLDSYKNHLGEIEKARCLDYIKDKPVVIISNRDETKAIKKKFGLTNVKFITATEESFRAEMKIVRETSPKKEVSHGPNPNLENAESIRMVAQQLEENRAKEVAARAARLAAEELEQRRIAAEQAEARRRAEDERKRKAEDVARLAAEELERQRIAAEKAAAEEKQRKIAEEARIAAEKEEAERQAAEDARLAQEARLRAIEEEKQRQLAVAVVRQAEVERYRRDGIPVPPPQPVPQEVRVVIPQKVDVALWAARGVERTAVLRELNKSDGEITAKNFVLDADFPEGSNFVHCLMWDVSQPKTLDALFDFAVCNVGNFENRVIFVATNADSQPANPLEVFGDLAPTDNFAAQKIRLTERLSTMIEDPVIMEIKSVNNRDDIATLKAKIFELARAVVIQPLAVEVKAWSERFERMKHSRQVRLGNLDKYFNKQNLTPKEIKWLLLHETSVKRNGLTARRIQDHLQGNNLVEDARQIEVNPVVPELLAFLDKHERLSYPKAVIFFRNEKFATDYIAKNYDGTRKAILDVAEKIYNANVNELTFVDRERIFGSAAEEANIPLEVIALVENHIPALRAPVINAERPAAR